MSKDTYESRKATVAMEVRAPSREAEVPEALMHALQMRRGLDLCLHSVFIL